MGGGPAFPISVPLRRAGPIATARRREIDRAALHLALREFRTRSSATSSASSCGANDWNISRTAQELGIERTNCHKRLRALGIEREDG